MTSSFDKPLNEPRSKPNPLVTVFQYLVSWLVKPVSPFLVILIQFGSHNMYRLAMHLTFVGSALLGLTTYGIVMMVFGGLPINLWQLVLLAYLVPFLWGEVIFGRIIRVPYNGWGYLCPDTEEVYKDCTIYTVVAQVPATLPTLWLLCEGARHGFTYLWYL